METLNILNLIWSIGQSVDSFLLKCSKFRFNQWNYYEQRQAHDIWGTL